MSRRNNYLVAFALSALAIALSGCGSDGGAANNPQAVVTIAAPKTSAAVPKPLDGPPSVVSGVFTTEFTFPSEVVPQLAVSVDAQQAAFIHLNTFAAANSANDEKRSANFATLVPNAGFSMAALDTTNPIVKVLVSNAGVSYVSFGEGAWSSVLMRGGVPPVMTELFRGGAKEVAVGPAAGSELFAARLVLELGSYALETRKTANGTWGGVERSTVALPMEFAPDRTAGGVRFQLREFTLRSTLSGTRGDAFIVSLIGDADNMQAFFPFSPTYGGDYLLWRERGSNELKTIAYKGLCQALPILPPPCLFDFNYAFSNLVLERSGDITYLSDEFDANAPLYGSRWFRAASVPQQIWLSPFSPERVNFSLRRRDRFDFVLAGDGSMRSWTTNGNEINLLEGPQGATPAPVPWASASGERSICREFVRCRVFRADSADRLAYLAWDKSARRATLFVSDRAASGGWKNVAFRDVSELLNELDDTGEIELSAFIAAGASDLVIGATRSGQFRERVKLFAVNVSQKLSN
jgi:hypothetical protein